MRLLRGPARLIRLLAIAAIGSTVLVSAGAGTALAATGYAPPPVPIPPGTPGGFSNVLITESAGGSGGTIGPVQSGPLRVTLQVPAGTFPIGATITLTSPNLLALGPVGGFPGYRVAGGIGVLVGFAGAKLHTTFIHPLILRIRSSSISPSSIVVVWSGSRWVRFTGAQVLSGQAILSIPSDSAFLVLNPAGPGTGVGHGRGHGRHHHHGRHHGRRHHGHRRGAAGMRYGRAALRGDHAALTSATLASDSTGTGQPFPAELAAVAAGLLAAAACGLAYVIRRRSGTRG